MSFPEVVHIAIILYGTGRSIGDKLPLEHYACDMFEITELVAHLQMGKELPNKLKKFWDQLPFMEDDVDDLITALFRLSKNETDTFAFGCAVDGHPVAFASSKSAAFTAVKLFHADIDVEEVYEETYGR